MRYFCTYFDGHYLARGLALHRSLQRHCPSFRLWVLCLDDACHDALTGLALPEIQPIALADFERGDDVLLQARQGRTRLEYYFTCTPSLPLYVLDNWPAVDTITYLDADLFFFSDPEPLFAELAERSVALIAHRFPAASTEWYQYGIYNVGWLSFRRDASGYACLRWWRERCLEWCHDRVEADRFADQKYLDDWPARFPGVAVLAHKGAGLAPWNLANHPIRLAGGHVWVADQPLVFYHFSGLEQVARRLFTSNLSYYNARTSPVVRQHIYRPYIRALLDQASAESILGRVDAGTSAAPSSAAKRLADMLKRLYRGLIARDYILLGPR